MVTNLSVGITNGMFVQYNLLLICPENKTEFISTGSTPSSLVIISLSAFLIEATFSKKKYFEFKLKALAMAKPHYVFEGDVLDLIRIHREYNGIVELMPVNSFDITSTIAKIIGIRNDY